MYQINTFSPRLPGCIKHMSCRQGMEFGHILQSSNPCDYWLPDSALLWQGKLTLPTVQAFPGNVFPVSVFSSHPSTLGNHSLASLVWKPHQRNGQTLFQWGKTAQGWLARIPVANGWAKRCGGATFGSCELGLGDYEKSTRPVCKVSPITANLAHPESRHSISIWDISRVKASSSSSCFWEKL